VVFVGEGQQGFDFLGFHCRKVKSWRVRGRRYLRRWSSRRAMRRERDRRACKASAWTAPDQTATAPASYSTATRVAERLQSLYSYALLW